MVLFFKEGNIFGSNGSLYQLGSTSQTGETPQSSVTDTDRLVSTIFQLLFLIFLQTFFFDFSLQTLSVLQSIGKCFFFLFQFYNYGKHRIITDIAITFKIFNQKPYFSTFRFKLCPLNSLDLKNFNKLQIIWSDNRVIYFVCYGIYSRDFFKYLSQN